MATLNKYMINTVSMHNTDVTARQVHHFVLNIYL